MTHAPKMGRVKRDRQRQLQLTDEMMRSLPFQGYELPGEADPGWPGDSALAAFAHMSETWAQKPGPPVPRRICPVCGEFEPHACAGPPPKLPPPPKEPGR